MSYRRTKVNLGGYDGLRPKLLIQPRIVGNARNFFEKY
jgi:hypothetical protein